MGKAGATVIGARAFLVAYNVYLDTDDVSVARRSARPSGTAPVGCAMSRGLGMLVDGKAQVSMNLTNFKRTPVYRVVEMIRREAARYGANITHSELIGLIPQQALIDAAVWYLQLDDFTEDQILEYKMNAELAAREGEAIEAVPFLDDLAAATPTPGGGSAAAYSGAMAAGLVAMVARLTVGKKKYADVEEQMNADHRSRPMPLKEAEPGRQPGCVLPLNRSWQLIVYPKRPNEQKATRHGGYSAGHAHAADVPLSVAEGCRGSAASW